MVLNGGDCSVSLIQMELPCDSETTHHRTHHKYHFHNSGLLKFEL